MLLVSRKNRRVLKPAFWRAVYGALTVVLVLVSEFSGWPPNVAPRVKQVNAATYTDDFNRSNGNLSGTWSYADAAWQISSNEVLDTDNTFTDEYAVWGSRLGADQYAQIDIVGFSKPNDEAFLVLRADSNSSSPWTGTNYHLFIVWSNVTSHWSLQFAKATGSGAVQMGDAVVTPVTTLPVTVRFSVFGNRLSASINGVEYASLIDNTITGGGYAGFGGFSGDGTTMIFDNWQAGDLTGGTLVSSRSDILSDPRPSATSNHTISFVTNSAIIASSTVAFTWPSAFSMPAGINCGDVDAATGTQFAFNYADCGATATAWGGSFSPTSQKFTLTAPSTAGTYVATGTPITIKIGSNATVGQQGQHWLTNPSTAGIYTISVGGTFGGSGNIPISINAGVTVAATVAESLGLTVSSVGAPILINHTGKTETGGPSVTSTAIDTTGANFLMVACHFYQLATPDVSDSRINSWHPLTRYGTGSNTYGYVQLFYAYNATAGTNHTFTCKNASASYNAITVSAFSNVWSSSDPFEAGSDKGATSSVVTIQPGSVTPLQTGDLIVSAWSSAGSHLSALSIDSGFSITDTVHDGFDMDGGMAYVVATTTNAYNPMWTLTGDPQNTAAIAVFKSMPTNCTADDGASINAIGTTAVSVPFGTINANTFYQACQDLSVSTNAGGGYSLAVQENHAMQTANGLYSIPDTTCDAGLCTSASSGAWVTPTQNGLGHTCLDQTGHDCAGVYSEGTKFRPFANVAGGTGGVTEIQHKSGVTHGWETGKSSTSVPFAQNNIAGDLLIVAAWSSAPGDASGLSGVSDSLGNTYFVATSTIKMSSGILTIWYAPNAKAGPNTVTVSAGSNTDIGVQIYEYAGLSASPLDQVGTNESSDNITVSVSTAGATGSGSELVFAVAYNFSNDTSWTAGSGYTLKEVIHDALDSQSSGGEVKIASNVGVQTATFTLSQSSSWLAGIATFKTLPSAGQLLMASSTPAIATGRVKYRLSASTNQAPGTYTNTITYTITATY